LPDKRDNDVYNNYIVITTPNHDEIQTEAQIDALLSDLNNVGLAGVPGESTDQAIENN